MMHRTMGVQIFQIGGNFPGQDIVLSVDEGCHSVSSHGHREPFLWEQTMMRSLMAAVLGITVAALAFGQMPKSAASANPLVDGAKMDYRMVKTFLIKSAEQVPENLYAYRPTPEVRTFGQIFGHIAEENYAICSAAAGEKPPVVNIEKTLSSKPDLVKALGESFAYCDKVFNSLTDANAPVMVNFFGQSMAKLSVMTFNTSHDNEHYGNIVTYMRLNKMVPPSSQK
jgi:uncharacterized damage-inducible protein DinB